MTFDEKRFLDEIADMLGKHKAEVIGEVRAKATEVKPNQPATPAQAEPPAEPPQYEQGMVMARTMRYLYKAKNDRDGAKEIAFKAGDQEVLKAMGEGTVAGGGALVSGAFSDEVVPVLRAKSVVRDIGIPTVPMGDGGFTIPYGDTGATAAWVGESANITNSEPTTALIQMTPKKLAIIGAASNELLEDSSGRSDRFLRDDLVRATKNAENSQLIRGTPSVNKPTSLSVLATAASNNAASAGDSLANKKSDLIAAIYRVENSDVEVDEGSWIFHPRTKWALMGTLDSNGNAPFEAEMKAGTLMGYPYHTTTAVPINLSGADSEVYFQAQNSLLIGEGRASELSVHPDAAYHNGSAVVSGLSLDQTVFKVTLRMDFNARFRGQECSLITSVSWA